MFSIKIPPTQSGSLTATAYLLNLGISDWLTKLRINRALEAKDSFVVCLKFIKPKFFATMIFQKHVLNNNHCYCYHHYYYNYYLIVISN